MFIVIRIFSKSRFTETHPPILNLIWQEDHILHRRTHFLSFDFKFINQASWNFLILIDTLNHAQTDELAFIFTIQAVYIAFAVIAALVLPHGSFMKYGSCVVVLLIFVLVRDGELSLENRIDLLHHLLLPCPFVANFINVGSPCPLDFHNLFYNVPPRIVAPLGFPLPAALRVDRAFIRRIVVGHNRGHIELAFFCLMMVAWIKTCTNTRLFARSPHFIIFRFDLFLIS